MFLARLWQNYKQVIVFLIWPVIQNSSGQTVCTTEIMAITTEINTDE